MEIVEYMKEQAARHPDAEPVDMVKFCYQAAFGAEHLLKDREAAFRCLQQELDRVPPDEQEPLYECLSDDICRVNLRAWKQRHLPAQWLFQMFAETASGPRQKMGEQFRDWLKEVGHLADAGVFGFDRKDWEAFLTGYSIDRPVAVHHSETYRHTQKPAYRLLCSRFIRIFPVLEAICAQGGFQGSGSGQCVVAIDGRCASGKTTLAELLAMVTGAAVVHMDDFFLPPELRTPERLREPGGNIHYERFQQEVLPGLLRREDFSYRCFDCSKMTFGEDRRVSGKGIVVVEGAYSCHPKFGEYMMHKVFCDIDPQTQQERIAVRDGEEALEVFRERWIPLEEAYLTAFKIKEQAAVII